MPFVMLLTNCHTTSSPRPEIPALNGALLAELDATGTWFHAVKTRPIWVKQVEQDRTVATLEGPVTARAGDFLCRGHGGELWPQQAQTLAERYTPGDRIDAEGWREYVPRPDAEGVMAAPVSHPFTVVTKWGPLEGKAGDYLLKNFRDRNNREPVDVWVVDRRLFEATYASRRCF